MTLSLYGKSRRRQGSLLLLGVLAVALMVMAALVASRDARAVALTLDDVDGAWSGAVGATPSITTNADYTVARWGVETDNACINESNVTRHLSGTADDRSGYIFDSVDTAQTFEDGDVVPLGAFTHINCPITGDSITFINLDVTLDFTAPATTTLTLPFTFSHDETPNGADPCAYGGDNGQGVNINGCADRVQVSGTPSDEFMVGDDLYRLQFMGFEDASSAEATACPAVDGLVPSLDFLTIEGQLNFACLYAKIIYSRPVIEVIKTPDDGTVAAGDDIEFTIQVKNNGDATATNVGLSDPLPAGFVWTDNSGSCSISSGVLSCTIAELVPGATFEVKVTAPTSVDVCGEYPNTATLTTHGLDSDDGQVTVECPPPANAQLRIKKVVTNVVDDPTGFSGKITLNGVDVAGATFSGLTETDADGVLFLLPQGSVYRAVETPPLGYTLLGYNKGTWDTLACPAAADPAYAGETLDATDVDPGGDLICIYNAKADKQIIIEKRFVQLPAGFTPDSGDYPTFTFDPAIEPAPACTIDTTGLPGMVRWTCTVPYSWTGTVSEAPPEGWARIMECEAPTDANFVFCNAPYGTVIVYKVNTSASGPDFTANIIGGAFPGNDVGGFPLDSAVTIAQGSPAGQSGVPLSNSAINVTEVDAGTAETCGSGATDYFTIVQAPGDTVLDTPYEFQIWTIVNQPCGVLGEGGIVLEKFRDNNGDGTANGLDAYEAWTFRITGPNAYDQTFVLTAAQMPYLVGELPPGNYTVSEQTPGGWKVIGLRVDNGALVAAATQTTVAVDGAANVLRGVTFYNQPRVNIEVNKTEISLATPAGAPGAAWSFTLTGCGITPQVAATGINGKATFSDLPPASGCSYAVTETVKAGWSAINPVQVTAPATAGQTAVLNFTNVKIEVPDVTPTPVPPTPVPPTETPVPPTATPEPPETPTEEAVAGEKTPGPTPVAPVTGTGAGGDGGTASMNILLLVVGLAVLSGGLTVAAARKRCRN